jgi:hypothetical protein
MYASFNDMKSNRRQGLADEVKISEVGDRGTKMLVDG